MRRHVRALLLGIAAGASACAAFSGDGAGDVRPAPADVTEAGLPDGAAMPVEDGGAIAVDGGADATVAVPPVAGAACGGRAACRVFVTSATWKGGELGGTAGADAKCRAAAAAGSVDGNFRAWIGDGVAVPATTFTHASVPYVLLGAQTLVASSWSDFVDELLAAPINVTESGQVIASDLVWTGVKANGTAGPQHCGGWASFVGGGTAGSTAGTSVIWSDLAPNPCGSAAHLYCVEQ